MADLEWNNKVVNAENEEVVSGKKEKSLNRSVVPKMRKTKEETECLRVR